MCTLYLELEAHCSTARNY